MNTFFYIPHGPMSLYANLLMENEKQEEEEDPLIKKKKMLLFGNNLSDYLDQAFRSHKDPKLFSLVKILSKFFFAGVFFCLSFFVRLEFEGGVFFFCIVPLKVYCKLIRFFLICFVLKINLHIYIANRMPISVCPPKELRAQEGGSSIFNHMCLQWFPFNSKTIDI